MTTELRITDASCGHCKQKIETAVSSLTEVTSASLDLDSSRLIVEHRDELDAQDLMTAIRDAGYTPELIA